MRRYVPAEDARATLAAINEEKAQSCVVMTVRFFVGNTDGTIVTNDGVWTITRILVTGVITHAGIQPIPPTPRWIAIAVASKTA
jgi:hypothetical protein